MKTKEEHAYQGGWRSTAMTEPPEAVLPKLNVFYRSMLYILYVYYIYVFYMAIGVTI